MTRINTVPLIDLADNWKDAMSEEEIDLILSSAELIKRQDRLISVYEDLINRVLSTYTKLRKINRREVRRRATGAAVTKARRLCGREPHRNDAT